MPLAKTIRRISLVVAWIVGIVAPIKAAKGFIESGKLDRYGVPKSFSDVLLNICLEIGTGLFGWFVFMFAIWVVSATPLLIFCAVKKIDEAEEKRRADKLLNVIWIATAIIITPITLFNIASSTKVPVFMPMSEQDPVAAIMGLLATLCGGIVLAGAYLYVYLAATGQLDDDKSVKPDGQ